eukprot:COSAG04_NODE_5471_length_1604_cov_2.278405_1_plen_117_part_00
MFSFRSIDCLIIPQPKLFSKHYHKKHGSIESRRNRNFTRGSAEPPRQRRKATRSWTPEEDAILRQVIHSSCSGDWGAVPQLVPDRNSKQCRERWLNHLVPGISKVDSPFLGRKSST